MAKIFFFGSFLLLCFAFFSALPQVPSAVATGAAAKDGVWVSPPSGVSCTMCYSCDNPCHALPPPAPPVPSLPPPSSPSNYLPPPSSNSYIYASPPPPSGYGYSYTPPFAHYPGPPPPNPIMPYFPFYFYSPPPPSKTNFSGSSPLGPPFVSTLQLFLVFLPFLLFF